MSTHHTNKLYRLSPCEATLIHHYRMLSKRSQEAVLGLAMLQSRFVNHHEASNNVIAFKPAPAA